MSGAKCRITISTIRNAELFPLKTKEHNSQMNNGNDSVLNS